MTRRVVWPTSGMDSTRCYRGSQRSRQRGSSRRLSLVSAMRIPPPTLSDPLPPVSFDEVHSVCHSGCWRGVGNQLEDSALGAWPRSQRARHHPGDVVVGHKAIKYAAPAERRNEGRRGWIAGSMSSTGSAFRLQGQRTPPPSNQQTSLSVRVVDGPAGTRPPWRVHPDEIERQPAAVGGEFAGVGSVCCPMDRARARRDRAALAKSQSAHFSCRPCIRRAVPTATTRPDISIEWCIVCAGETRPVDAGWP